MTNLKPRRRFSMALLLVGATAATGITGATAALADDEPVTVEDYRAIANWSALSMDLEVNLTGEIPQYTGTIKLRSNAASLHGPVLILDNRDVGMKLLDLKVRGGSKALPKYTIEMHIPNPTGRKSKLAAVHFETPVPASTELELSYDYEFVAEQGQVLHKPELDYASWVTGWYPRPIADAEGLQSLASFSMPGKISFVLPETWDALSNGKLVRKRIEGGVKYVSWKSDDPIAWSYVAAPFTVSTIAVGDTDVSMYMLNPDQEIVKQKAILIAKIITLLEEKFGNYPFKTFGLAEIPDNTTDYFGAASEQGFIVAETKNFVNDFGLTLFSHEVAHSWWGNKFSCTGKGSSLCTEAMAQIGTILGTELLHGKNAVQDLMDASVPNYNLSQSARGFFALWRTGHAIPLGEVEGGWKVHRLMDSKGMWFWQMLREEVGDEKFFSVLRSLSNDVLRLSLVELEEYFSEKTKQDLSVFFDQWLNRTGAPIVDMEWKVISQVEKNPFGIDGTFETITFGQTEGVKKIEVTLTQEQKELYKLKPEIEVQFYYAPSVTRVVDFEKRKQIFEFEFEEAIKDIVLDPEHKILMWRPAYGPKPKL